MRLTGVKPSRPAAARSAAVLTTALPTTPAVLIAAAVLAIAAPPASGARVYDWPLAPRPAVTRPFAPPARPWLAGHRGVDLGTRANAAVIAAGAGRVRFAGAVAGRPTVSVTHPDGIVTTYEPVRAIVSAGQPVSRGQVLGYLDAGHPGCPVAACLHWGARRGSGHRARYLNPLALVGAVRVRLLPIGAGRPVRPADAPGRAPRAAVPR